MQELIVDNFAGGGGASTGIELATGRSVDIAINHDPAAIAMHKANHPTTKHYCENVWEVDPVEAVAGRPVGLAWFSPDCKHFSKAKGGKPVEKNIRGLAWVAIKWAKLVRPRVIMLENVEEFKTWGPLIKDKKGDFYPDPSKKGETFDLFIKALKRFGYTVDFRELRACDFGAPTTRKRFFLVARCDGKPIKWPEPTHGDPEGIEVRCGLLKPWRTAKEIIDWNKPCPSIFERKRPLKENTLKRIARGIQKFVINNPEPFIVQVNHSGASWDYCNSVDGPLKTVTSKNGFGLVTPYIACIGQTSAKDRSRSIKEPISTVVSKQEHMLVTPYMVVNNTGHLGGSIESPVHTITTGGHHALVAPTLIQYHTETSDKPRGQGVEIPIQTLDSSNRYGLVTSFLTKFYKTCTGQQVTEPLHTVTTSPGHFGEVRAFLLKYYGSDVGQKCTEPLHTVTTKDRFGLVTIKGEDYQIVDIGMRMLEPYELYAAQGFPEDYQIEFDYNGKKYSKKDQVARCGNAVPPPFAEALVRENLPEMCDVQSEVM